MSEPLHLPEPELTDGVIRLRRWHPDDAAWVHRAVQDPEIPRFLGIPPNHTLEGVQRWLSSVVAALDSGDEINLAVVSATSGDLLGSVGVTRSCDDPAIGEVGYWVDAAARCSQVATRAVDLIVPWAFDVMRLARVELTTHEDNVASLRVAEKTGFAREGLLRSYREQHGRRVDLVMLARLAPGASDTLRTDSQ